MTAQSPEAGGVSPRLDLLTSHFLDVGHHRQGPDTQDYFYHNGSLRLCLAEIIQISGPTEAEAGLNNERQEYVELVVKPPSIIPGQRRNHKRRRNETREVYIDGVVDRIAQIVDATTPEEALSLRQLPTVIEGTKFDGEVTEEKLASFQMSLLIDTALVEHVARRKIIDDKRAERRTSKVLGSRPVRMAIALGVFVASIVPSLHFIPIHNPELESEVQLGLEIASATTFAVDAPEQFRWWRKDITHGKKTKKLRGRLASSQRSSDLALRMVYGDARYMDTPGKAAITGRSGTKSSEENLARFDRLDSELKRMNNDPGGRPYTGKEALGYAARLLLEKDPQLDSIIEADKTPEQRRSEYLALSKEIITEDVMRMEDGLGTTKFRQKLFLALGIAIAFAAPNAVSAAAGSSDLSSDVADYATNMGAEEVDEDA